MTRILPDNTVAENDLLVWEKAGDQIDQLIDLMLNFRQSGHPGGSRSKTRMMVALTLSGAMRWDIRNPDRAFADRFVLASGHCTPVIYGMLALYHEALNRMLAETGDEKYAVPNPQERQLVWKDLLQLRRNKGLPGHAEAEGKTLFFHANTGPSGHGGPAAAGIALGLKMAGANEVKVWTMEGEGGLTAGAHHETKQTAWGLGLSNLHYLVDWNDNGIDPRPYSAVVPGEPNDWFLPYGWQVSSAEDGHNYGQLAAALSESLTQKGEQPHCTWFRTVKGRGYGVTGYKSHGAAHKPNSELFWETKREFQEKYGLEFEGFGQPQPESHEEFKVQTTNAIQKVLSLLDEKDYCEALANRLVTIAESVPEEIEGVHTNGLSLSSVPEFATPESLPDSLFFKPGEKQPNRIGFSKVAAWINSVARKHWDRPLVLAASADLADSTNISGFAHDWEDSAGFGWYEKAQNPGGALLPTAITEFGNAGLVCGLASTNLSNKPEDSFSGFWGACSTYGSFSYLKYGPMRLFSQLCQDSPFKQGKVIWVAGHSGPETAEDSRTHFGVFAPGITQFFPRGQVIDIHPWEPNEVGPALLAAMRASAPIIALHLTRPPVEIPHRENLGMGSHFEAARGAYLIRDYDPNRPPEGCVFVRGTSATQSIVQLLQEGRFEDGPNIKLVAAISHELFTLQSREYQEKLVSKSDWQNSTFITNGARQNMWLWTAHSDAFKYSMGSDWDDRWRTGGSLEEIIVEAKLDPKSLWSGLQRFAKAEKEKISDQTEV